MIDKFTRFEAEHIALAAGFIFMAIIMKTIFHAASRTFVNFVISLFSGYFLGFVSFFLVGELLGAHVWVAITISIFVSMISDRIFAAFLATNTASFFKWAGGFISHNLQQLMDALINRVGK